MLLPLLVLSATSNITISSASSKGEVSCYDRGIIDGEDHPFNQRSFDSCGDEYYEGFMNGCMSVEGNSRDVCESATDA